MRGRKRLRGGDDGVPRERRCRDGGPARGRGGGGGGGDDSYEFAVVAGVVALTVVGFVCFMWNFCEVCLNSSDKPSRYTALVVHAGDGTGVATHV